MKTKKLYRTATVSREEAIRQFFANNPKADLEAFRLVTKNGVKAYEASIRVAEFPPSDDGGEEEKEPKKKDGPPEDDGGEDAAPDFAPDDGLGDDQGDMDLQHHKPPVEEQILHVLTEILHKLPGGGGDPMGQGDGDLMDVGAPPQGEGLSGGPSKGPLPPPVPSPKASMPGSAFASRIAGRNAFPAIRQDATQIGNRGMMVEAGQVFPGYKVQHIQRTGAAMVEGKPVALAEANIAVLTMVRA